MSCFIALCSFEFPGLTGGFRLTIKVSVTGSGGYGQRSETEALLPRQIKIASTPKGRETVLRRCFHKTTIGYAGGQKTLVVPNPSTAALPCVN